MEKKPRGALAAVTGTDHGPDFDVEGHYDTWATAYDDDLLNEYG